MSRYRLLGLVLFLACLLTAPFAFGEKDKDKGKSGDSKKSTPAKTSTDHSSHHSSGSSNNDHHGSSSQSSTSSATTSSPGSHDHSGDTHHHGDSSSQSQTSAASASHSHDSTATQHSHQGDASHGTHEATHSSQSSHAVHERSDSHHVDSRHVDTHHVVIVDHARLHERMSVHPGSVERQHAFEHSRAERVRFERHVGAIHFVPAHRVVLTRLRIVPTTYFYRRSVFYDTYGWHAPGYVYHLYPRYGLWDAVFLSFALDHIAEEEYALMFYHHRHDAEIEQWMDDNERLAADNEELRAELDDMKSKMDTFEQSGVTADPSYVPEDAQDVALSPEVIDQLTTKKD